MSRSVRFALLAAITAGTVVPGVLSASAATPPRPAAPTGVKVSAATSSGFTVVANKAANTKKYVLFASRDKSDITFQHLGRPISRRVEVESSHPKLTVTGRKYTVWPYYYRVQTKNGDRSSLSDIYEAYLAPRTPTQVQAKYVDAKANTGLSLHWAAQDVAGFIVEQATNRTMTQNLKTYQVHGTVKQFTPYGLKNGVTYYFRLRSVNGASASKPSPVTSLTFNGNEATFKLLTWNVLHAQFDGTKENGNTIASWSKRVKVVTSMIKKADPDVITINEANDWWGPRPGRQIDLLARYLKKLPGQYQLCDADFSDGTGHHPRTGNYIFYRQNMFRPLYQGAGGKAHYFEISKTKRLDLVTYQALVNVATGAKFLLVVQHLPNGPADKVHDSIRRVQVQSLLGQVAALQARDPDYAELPIIFAGDTNSYVARGSNNLDSPDQLYAAAGATESRIAAQKATNTQYSSVNGYRTRPQKEGRIIDHLYGTAGVAFQTWKQVMDLKHGQWPGVIPSDHNPIMAKISLQS